MPVFALNKDLVFPPVQMAQPDGLLAIGGDLSPERLVLAYKSGIFPWFEGDMPLWWSPDPRFVLFPGELKISRSMKQLMKKEVFGFSVNRSFKKVIDHCKDVKRKGQHGTWITDDVAKAFYQLHKIGLANSTEAWFDGKLVGGQYGIRMGKVFFGESMFSIEPNASKFAFIKYVELLQQEGVELIDCQVYSQHLETLGARMIPRTMFIDLLGKLIPDL